ncbi:Protein hook [Frankliniella fusca]|uniref:Protein hook n=1 Tax=Frankliniella fusca TaxID=407009 RepID=A0AAE1HD91_9NEOP|nr:Protein hook [Frankliniella fusca]
MALDDNFAREVVPILGHRVKLLQEIGKMKKADPRLTPVSVSCTPSLDHLISSTPTSRTSSGTPPEILVETQVETSVETSTWTPAGAVGRRIADFDFDDDIDSDVVSSPAATDSWEALLKISQPNAVQRALLNRKPLRVLSNYPASKNRFKVRRGVKREKVYEGLDVTHKRLLCDILVKEHCKDFGNLRNITSLVDSLANDIQATFPKESKHNYYVPFRCVKVDGKTVKRINARGKLYSKFTNYLKVLREEYVTPSSRNTSTLITSETADVDASLAWLNKRVEICPRLRSEWDVTRDARINSLRNRIDTRGENYLEKYIHSLYPFLKQPNGHLLLLADFNALYPDKKNCLFMEWNSFSESVKRLAGVDNDTSDCEVLYLLGDLFEEEGLSSVPVTRKYRASKHEMLHSFLLNIENVEDVDKEISAYVQKAALNKSTPQPYAIAVGEWPHPKDFYVWYTGVLHRVDSARDAIDVTFKVFHALHGEYPKTSACFWMLLQHHIYNIETAWDLQIPEVRSLACKLR